MKILKIVTLVLLLSGFIFYFFPVPEKDFGELYDADDEVEASLLKFRETATQTLKVGEVNWQYYSGGTGDRAILFLHGMGGAYDIWWQQIEALKDSFRIISTTCPAVNNLEDAIEGLSAILEKEGISKVSIVGSSMGGYMAQYFTIKYPEKVDKLVLGNTFPPNDVYAKQNGGIRSMLPFIPEWLIMSMFRSNLSTKVTPFSGNSPLVEAYLLEQYYGHMSKKQFMGRLDMVLEQFEPSVGKPAILAIPKLIIKSDNDPLVSPVLREALVAMYPEATIFTFQGKGHFPYLNASAVYTEQLSDFLLRL